jgi:hypothetical protein
MGERERERVKKIIHCGTGEICTISSTWKWGRGREMMGDGGRGEK